MPKGPGQDVPGFQGNLQYNEVSTVVSCSSPGAERSALQVYRLRHVSDPLALPPHGQDVLMAPACCRDDISIKYFRFGLLPCIVLLSFAVLLSYPVDERTCPASVSL